MEPLAIALVFFSAVCHAGWNFLIKGFDRPLLGMWAMTGLGLLLFLPVLLQQWHHHGLSIPPLLGALIVVSGLTKSGYYVTLAATYSRSDLSLGYPLSRTGILLVPVWAYLFLGEKISPMAGVGIVTILVGIYVLNMGPLRLSRITIGPGVSPALATAFLISVFSVIDKSAMDMARITPLSFLYLMFVPTWLGITAYLLLTGGIRDLHLLRGRWRRLAYMSFADFGGYGAVLMAMGMSKVSYVIALRQIAIVLGALMGATLLREHNGAGRVLGAAIIFAGAVVVSVSR